MQNYNVLLSVRSLSLTSLIKALQLSKVSLSTIKHQHSNSDTMDRSRLKQKVKTHEKCQLFARVCPQEVFKCPPFVRTHAWRRFLHWSIAVSMMSCRTSGHTAIKLSFSSLRTVNEQKVKC